MNQSPSIRRISGVIACAAACALLAACPFDKPEEHLARGKEEAAKQNHGAAAIEFKNYLQSVPRSPEARFLLGRELLAQGDLRGAEIELQKAYDGRYDRDAVVPLLVEVQLLQGTPERISDQIARTELKTPAANAQLQSLLGNAALAQGRVDDALRAFRSAMQYQPDLPSAHLGEARVSALHGDLDRASELVTPVLAQDPKNFEALVLKGDIARGKNQAKDAIDAYLAAIQVSPRKVSARLKVTELYMLGDMLQPAEQQVVQMKKIAPRHAEVNYDDALLAFGRKDYLRANDAITLSLGENAVNGAAQILSGAISFAMNQPAQAEAHLVEGIKLAPNSIFGRRLLSSLYLRQNQTQKAADTLQPALAALPNDGSLLALAGEVALQQGDYATASKAFDRAAQLDPTNSDIAVRQAATQVARGDQASGLAVLEAAAKANPENPRPDVALVVTRLNLRQYDEALVAWKDLEKRLPDSPTTYNLRAAIAMGKDDHVAARAAFERALQLQPKYFPAVRNLASLDELEGHVDAARQRYRAYLDKDRTNVDALLALAQFEMKHGSKPDVVVPLLQEARRASPDSDVPVSTLVSYYASQGDLKQALATVQDGLNVTPNNPTLLYLVAELQMKMGGVDQAIAAYRKLLTMKPDAPEYQIRLAQAMVLANQADLAETAFEKLIKDKPEAYALQTVAVTTMVSAKRLNEANRLIAQIHRVSPKSPVVTELEGDVKLASRQYADAASSYRRAMAQTPTSQLLMKEYLAVQMGGNAADANTLLAAWMKSHPADVTVRLFDADRALLAKDYTRAAAGYRAALDAKPDDLGALNNLAWALYQAKDPKAIEYAEKAHALAPGAPAINDTLGWILVDRGDTKRGLPLLQQALAVAPGQQAIALHVAKALIKDGQKDAAKTALLALQKSAPGTAEARESRDLMATL